MKKKILLFAMMIAVLACLFAICVGAETVTYEGKEIELKNDLGDPSWYTGNTALAIQDKESIVILKDSDGNMVAYPSYYILKFGVDVKDGKVTNAYVLWADQKGVDYSFVNEKTGKNYTNGSVYYIEFPNGMTRCKANSIFGRDNDSKPEPNVVEIVIPDSVTEIEEQAFRRMNSCKKVTMSKNVTRLLNWTFCGSSNLATVIFPEGSLLQTTGNSFSGCTSLSSVNLEACTSLNTLGGTFDGCTSLRKITLPDSIETICDKAFYKNGELELGSDYLPKNLKCIGSYDSRNVFNGHFLSGCTIVNEVLYFPEGFTDFSSLYNFNDGFAVKTHLTFVFLGKMTCVNLNNTSLTSFYYNGSKKPVTIVFAKNTFDELNGVFLQLTTLNGTDGYIGKNADGSAPYTTKASGTLTLTLNNNDPNSSSELGKDANGNSIYKIDNAPAKLIFCGRDNVELSYSVRNCNTDKGWYRFLTTSKAYDMNAHASANVHYNSIVYQEGNCGYDETTTKTCVICKLQSVVTGALATGNHTYTDDFNCETALDCEVCKKTLQEALTHDNKTTVVYENGYTEAGLKTVVCQNEGCKCELTEELKAIFTFAGISTKISDTVAGITLGFEIDAEALEAYESAQGKLKFGFVVAFKDLLGGNAPIVNGEKATVEDCNIVMVDASNDSYTKAEFVLKGEKSLWENEEILVKDKMLKDAELVLACYTIDSLNNTTYFNYSTSESNNASDFSYAYSGIEQVE